MSDKPTTENESEVGFGKPPREHQFAKGKSGNPAGRPKKKKASEETRPLAAILASVLRRPVTVTQGKRQQSIGVDPVSPDRRRLCLGTEAQELAW